MHTTIRLNTNELTMDFLKGIKKMFHNKEITLTIDVDMDETDFLLSNETNKARLLESIKNVEAGKTIEVDLKQFQK